MADKQYAERDIMDLDISGNHYSRHISAMTREGLHSKSDIAAELAWRDARIAMLEESHGQVIEARDLYKKIAANARQKGPVILPKLETWRTFDAVRVQGSYRILVERVLTDAGVLWEREK